MAADRTLRILERLARAGGDAVEPVDLVEVARGVVAMTGAGIMLLPEGATPVTFSTTDRISAFLHQTERELGEGPELDAHRMGATVLEPNLAEPAHPRWPSFAPVAAASGVRAVFSAPIRIGAVRLGALSLWRDQPGALSDEQHADTLVLADVAARFVLDLQSSAPTGIVDWAGGDELGFENIVHQAAGMLSVQLGIGLDIALLRLRAHAFATERSLAEVAADVLARRLRLDPEPPVDDPTS